VRARRRTSTSNFGAGARESHDASRFYERFRAPELSTDDAVAPPRPLADPFVHGDARHMDAVADGSVALVVTSPPYFAGKQYEEELSRDGVPSSYLEYLELLTDVFAECARKLEPGGRLAVNVANLGRKPYRSLSADVIRILEHDLGLLLRGEVIWQKAEGATGSCAWGSFRRAANPVLRDITERVVIASKGRFDRARAVRRRAQEGLPNESTVLTEDFLALTLDVWSIPPESARRVGHPAPFPVELPAQLIRLYTFADDLVLDPFMGSGSALVAAAGLGRRYAGYDLDAGYVEIARRRVAEAVPLADGRDPRAAEAVAADVVAGAGFTIAGRRRRVAGSGVAVDLVLTDATGATWHADVAGPSSAHRGGMQRIDVVWRALGRAAAVRGRAPNVPYLLLTTDLPRRPGDGDAAVRAAGRGLLFDVVDVFDDDARARLACYAAAGPGSGPCPGFWPASACSTLG
jgi:modification methylase